MRKYWWLLVLPTLLLIWWGVSRGETTATIHFSSAKHADIESAVPTNGKVEPAEWSATRAETSGVVRTVNVSRGESVKAGQTLVTLDPNSARADLASALARQQEAEAESSTITEGGKAATLADLNGRIAAAQSAVEITERVYTSDQRLLSQQAVTKLQVDNDKDALDRARLNLAALQNQKRSIVTPSDRTVAGARLQDARQAVALARHRVQLTDIKAPAAGTIYEFDLKVGAYLQPGTLVAKVGDLDQVKVIVYVDEPDLGRVALDMPVTITAESRPGQKWQGHVDKLPTEIVPQGTRAVGEVSTIIENPQHDLLPGVSVNATIVSKVVKNALAIPKTGLRRLGTVDGVYKLEGDTLAWTPVTTGISDINNVQIVSGLEIGDKVADRVVDPSDSEIRNGMRVKPVLN